MKNTGKPFLIPDLEKLRRDVASARGLSRLNIDRLYGLLEPDPHRSPREVYDLHWSLVQLLDGKSGSVAKARAAVLCEAMEGGPPSRPGHSWNDPNFFRMHFWISAAMAAHIALALDWTAEGGGFRPDEVREIGRRFVDGFWEHVYPHLKGRGRAPIYMEPMNQDSAMVAGCLMVGHLFGEKWDADPRAKRMYADARVLAGNLLGQFFRTGFDNDGFTYMRVIQPPVLCLIAMIVEEVEGRDFFFARFAPSDFSIALFMEKLQRFHLPSGSSFPHGRYGYVREWNLYSQAYAARKTGEAHYLERALESGQRHYITPWVAMDLPLAVVFAPYGGEAGAPRDGYRPVYESWHDEEIWSNLADAESRVFAQLSWRIGQHGTVIAEQDGERAVVLLGESGDRRNGIWFKGVSGRKGRGRDFQTADFGWMQVSRIQLAEQWDEEVLGDYRKYLLVFRSGLVLLLDHFAADREIEPVYCLSTVKEVKDGWMETEKGTRRIQVLCSAGALKAEPRSDNVPAHLPGLRHTVPMASGSRGFAASLVNFSQREVTDFTVLDQGVSWREEAETSFLFFNPELGRLFEAKTPGGAKAPSEGRKEAFGRGHLDASVLLFSGSQGFALFDVQRWKSPSIALWSTCKIEFSLSRRTEGPRYAVLGLEYGHYLRYREDGLEFSILKGNGYDILARLSGGGGAGAGIQAEAENQGPAEVTLELPGIPAGAAVQVNGRLHSFRRDGGHIVVSLRPQSEPLAEAHLAVLRDIHAPKPALLLALDAAMNCGSKEALEPIRRLLQHSDTYIRLAAAEALGFIGQEADAPLLLARLLEESQLTSEIGGLGAPWHGKWGFFPAITVMADALRKLGNREVAAELQKALALQVEPHTVDAIKTAVRVLSLPV